MGDCREEKLVWDYIPLYESRIRDSVLALIASIFKTDPQTRYFAVYDI